MRRIYLDHAATTPLLPEVREAMAPWLDREFGNPSSLHEEGRRARAAIDEAREVLSGCLGCLFAEVLFTSSGTEAANLAIVGAALANEDPSRRRVLVGAAEHHCVLHTRPLLEKLGFRVEPIQVDRIGRLRLDTLEQMLGPDVLLVSVMHANNELGTIQPAGEALQLARQNGALFHCDAVQTFGFPEADLITYSAHKIYGPKGVGAIYIKAGTKVKPLAVGGGQEREMRAGTENVAGIVGFAAAVKAMPKAVNSTARDVFLERLAAAGFVPTVPDSLDTLPGHAHGRFPGIDAETILIRLDRAGVSASSGAACSSGSLEPSHVLLACGYSEKEAKEGLRFTFGRFSTVADAEEAAARVINCATGLRK
ncbi:MAG TPA: cysteine desulfurase family protein [Fimbriimonadaceae bacterium]|nr:cysteine desulfurase family protein [Fimbriimonadaceae bacterium]